MVRPLSIIWYCAAFSVIAVFISYSHDSPEHKQRVRAVAERLLSDGIEVILDQYVYGDSPAEGWPRWMDRQITDADCVLLVCTETYRRRVDTREQPGVGHGVLWEGNLVYQHIYNAATQNERFIPVLLDGAKPEDIPAPLQGVSHYRPETEDGYEALYRRITNQPRVRKPSRGALKVLPPDRLSDAGHNPFDALEYYRAHQSEIDLLADDRAMFLLVLIQRLGPLSRSDMSRHTGWEPKMIGEVVDRLALAGAVGPELDVKRVGLREAGQRALKLLLLRFRPRVSR